VKKDYIEFLRADVRAMINAHCQRTACSHSLAWRRLYLALEGRTGYRVPDEGKSKLQMIEDARFMDELHELASKLH